MKPERYEFRLCMNPDCRLRFPWYEGQGFGERCPHCMGRTESAMKSAFPGGTSYSRNRLRIPEFSVLLDNIRSAWNAGSILRSAEVLGFSHAFLCGITPGPDNLKVRKTSLGAENSINWSMHKDATALVKRLDAEDYYIMILETGERAIPLSDVDPKSVGGRRIVLVVGNEVTGVDPDLIDAAHLVTCIPVYGKKASLNVAVAFGTAAFFLSTIFAAGQADSQVNDAGEKGHR